MNDKIRIIDKRKGMFLVDNAVLNGYGKGLGATGIAFYVTLCRYANNQSQKCFPSITTIARETGMDRKTIIAAANKAVGLGLIKKDVKTGRATIYTLLDPTSGKSTLVKPTGGKSTPTSGKNTLHQCGNSTALVEKAHSNELRERTKRTNLDNVGKLSKESLKEKREGDLPEKEWIKKINSEWGGLLLGGWCPDGS